MTDYRTHRVEELSAARTRVASEWQCAEADWKEKVEREYMTPMVVAAARMKADGLKREIVRLDVELRSEGPRKSGDGRPAAL